MNNFFIVFKKELKDIFRDRKTIIFSILLPILIFPIIFNIMFKGIEDTQKKASQNINIVMEGDLNSSVANILKSQSNISIKDVNDPSKALKDGDVQLIIDIPKNFDKLVSEGKKTDLQILFDENSNNSQIASNIVEKLLSGLSDKIVSDKLTAKGINPSILKPFDVSVKSGLNKDGNVNPMASGFGSMIPSLIIILMISPTLAIAADLGAGEKERNTLEPLLSTSCNRSALLWGKIISMSVVSSIALILSLSSMYFAMQNIPGMEGGFSLALNGSSIALILLISLLLLIAICSLETCVSLYAKSVKEAGTYLSGLVMPFMILSYVPVFMDAKNTSMLIFNIPIANSVALMKEVMVGIYNPTHIAIVFGWHILYVVAAVLFARYMFSKEEVIFRS